PATSVASVTGRPISSASRSAAGARESSGTTCPLGRPRWEQSTTRAFRPSRSSIVGRAAPIRVSSVTRPSASGTLKSTRTRTRLPSTSASVTEALLNAISALSPWRSSAWLENLAEQLDAAVRVAPLVVVPGDRLDQVAVADHLGELRVEDRRVRIADDVGRDD